MIKSIIFSTEDVVHNDPDGSNNFREYFSMSHSNFIDWLTSQRNHDLPMIRARRLSPLDINIEQYYNDFCQFHTREFATYKVARAFIIIDYHIMDNMLVTEFKLADFRDHVPYILESKKLGSLYDKPKTDRITSITI